MFALIRKDINNYFASPAGYVVLLSFLGITGVFLWLLPNTGFYIPGSRYASLDPLFILAPWVLMFLVPAITMRSFSEEIKSGTLELLVTKPIPAFSIILGKFIAHAIISLVALLPTLFYYYLVYKMASPAGNIDFGGINASYAGLILLVFSFTSIGLFFSVISANQVVAFILGVTGIFFLYTGFDFISELINQSFIKYFLLQHGMSAHYSSLSKGIIDSRDVLYFFTITFLFLMFSKIWLSRNN